MRSAQNTAIKSISSQQVKSTKDLTKRIAAGDAKLDKRISKELSGQKKAHRRHAARVNNALKTQRQRALWNNILLGTALPIYSAYGVKSDPFAKQNLILTGSLAAFLLGDEVVDRFLTDGKSGKTFEKGATAWSYAAPPAYAGLMYYLMKDYQHERFVTGRVSLSGANATATVDLKDHIAEKSFDDFKGISNPVVNVTIESGNVTAGTTLSGWVDGDGKLQLSAAGSAAADNFEVSWKVDTLKP